MTRGHQKEAARARAAKEADKHKGGKSQLSARAAGNQMKCPKCLTPVANYKLIQQHMEAKHPKETIPPEEDFA
ncbi:hypothetical protein K450DRAFT_268620 [Umbelopsis ramanniana AG]|uniref:Small EDRK-rich factor-like N-terminal domain-containing protein n=1 Tax=Umbelopsis ramanniana AG TaxID=1314678 RepID=A0AAD5EFU2_UMBRA|nr:uncharacterized protein K450DRAFT_268620 [Umbelopsis ramanniana AG]KAI8583093.1 hypothetical protein K450DRAFT_268620 [Umbelopsis ramanniana AG]